MCKKEETSKCISLKQTDIVILVWSSCQNDNINTTSYIGWITAQLDHEWCVCSFACISLLMNDIWMWLGLSILIIKDRHLLLHSWTNILSYRASTTWKQRKLRTLDSQAGCCTSFHNSSSPLRCWPSWCFFSTSDNSQTYINHNLEERQQRNFLVFEFEV